MAIYLDDQTTSEIKRILKKEIERSPHNFIAPRLLKMVENDDQRKENIKTCTHKNQRLFGFKEECNKCHGKVNGYEVWVCEELKETLGVEKGNGEQTTHQSKDFGNTAPSTLTHPDQSTLL